MPTWMTPGLCTAAGIFGAMVTMIGYVMSRFNTYFLWLANFGFAINWFGDSMDGTLARQRGIERPLYGFFVDHTADAFNEMVILLGVGLSPYVRFDLACLVLSVYFLLSILSLVRMSVFDEFRISYWKLGPTEARVWMMLLNTTMYFGGMHTLSVHYGVLGTITFSPYDLILLAVFLFMFFSSVVFAI